MENWVRLVSGLPQCRNCPSSIFPSAASCFNHSHGIFTSKSTRFKRLWLPRFEACTTYAQFSTTRTRCLASNLSENCPENSESKAPELVHSCYTSPDGSFLRADFQNGSFTFHAQWLHDARCENGPSRDAASAFCQKPATARIAQARIIKSSDRTVLNTVWTDGSVSEFPALWLRLMAPIVAQRNDILLDASMPKGWKVRDLTIPQVSYSDIFPETVEGEKLDCRKLHIFRNLLHESTAGIIKVVGCPSPKLEDERNKTNTLVTRVLKGLFGSVFVHPRRGTDKTFNVASHHQEDTKRAAGLPNYDTNQILLPHVDHAHYTHPIRVQGWYGLEGESENTFVSAFAVLSTLQEEAPEFLLHLANAPMAVGRVAHYYEPPMFQATVDTAITMQPGFPDRIQRVRWHPHLTGSLLSPFETFFTARAAHEKFQEIMRRETHQLKVLLKPGDLYIWDNFRILHGRESVVKVPRTGVGQTVPEQVVADRYRALAISALKRHMDERWLVHLPNAQLSECIDLLEHRWQK